MKSWRTQRAQAAFRRGLIADTVSAEQHGAAFELRRSGLSRIRVGRRLNRTYERILSAPSWLVQALMIRVGLAQAA